METHANAAQAGTESGGPRLAYACVKVLDLERSLHFYGGLLGMRQRRRLQPGAGLTELLLDGGDPASGGLMLIHDRERVQPYVTGDGFSRLILYVTDLEPLAARLHGAGVEILRAPTRVAVLNISIMLLRDPDGYVLELIQRY